MKKSRKATRKAAGKETRRAPYITIPGVDFEPHIDRLLKLADVVNTEDARLSLKYSLGMAWANWDLDRETKKMRIPAGYLSKLEASIRKTQGLLRNSEEYPGLQRVRFVNCPVGEGTVATKTFEPGKWGETVPFPPDPLPPLGGSHETVPPGGMIASINIRRTLDRVLREIALAKRSRARPREKGKRSIVAYAAKFFREYSATALMSYPSGPFATFCRSFYEAVTGLESLHSGDLQSQIRAEVKSPTFSI